MNSITTDQLTNYATTHCAARTQLVDAIFLHSMFRTGSTYVFHKLRSLSSHYTCYQEALHELTVLANNDPILLLQDAGKKKATSLRHPALKRPYFQELHDAWPLWQNTLGIESVYGRFFDQNDDDGLRTFFLRLHSASRSRPVFCETRSHYRIAPLKKMLGGTHVYLWRNPWDQWWSYQVAPYFDALTYLLSQLADVPRALLRVRDFYRIPTLGSTDAVSVCQSPTTYRLTAEESYALFYTLWCISLAYGKTQADFLINIDRLSECDKYRAAVSSRLSPTEGERLDFSDCAVPQGIYGAREKAFFRAIERRVRALLLPNDMDDVTWRRIQEVRRRYSPRRHLAPSAAASLAPYDQYPDILRATYRRAKSQFAIGYRTISAEMDIEKGASEATRLAASALKEQLAAESQAHAVARTTVESQQLQLLTNATAIAHQRERLRTLEAIADERQGRVDQLNGDNCRLLGERDLYQQISAHAQRRIIASEACIEAVSRDAQRLERDATAAAAEAAYWQRQVRALRSENDALLATAADIAIYQRDMAELAAIVTAERTHASAAKARHAALASERAALTQAIDALWQTVQRASGPQAGVTPSSELSALTASHQKLTELCHSSHAWHLEAQRLREAVDALVRSRSWRVTRPLRAAALFLRAGASVGHRTLYRVLYLPRTTARYMLIWAMRYVLQHPRIAMGLKPLVARYPTLKARLRAFAVAHGLFVPRPVAPSQHRVVASSTLHAARPVEGDQPTECLHLGPRARAIYQIIVARSAHLKRGQI